MTTKETVMRQAIAAVTGARQDAYGGPKEAFQIAAEFTEVYIRNRKKACEVRGIPYEHSAVDQVLLMVLIKVSRLISSPKHTDSWRDLCGYGGCGAEVAECDPTDQPLPVKP
jgi:hypothetical protein